MKRRVVVTGIGCVTPVGNDVATTWSAILDGKSGAAPITKFDASTWPVRFACELKGFDPLVCMDRKEAKRADPYTQYAMAAAVQAMADAGFSNGKGYVPEDTGVIIGSGIGGLSSFEDEHDVYRERGQSKISPFFIPKFIADIAAGVVSMRFQAKGPNYATVSACATSAHAIGDATRTIQYGDARRHHRGRLGGGGHADGHRRLREHEGALRAQRRRPARRAARSTPQRDGFVMGEGAGVRDPRGARARAAARRAHLRRGRRLRRHRRRLPHHGAGSGRRGRAAGHAPRAQGRGARRRATSTTSTRTARRRRSTTSTRRRRSRRSSATHAAGVDVSSTKSMTGHLLGAAGAVEFILGTLAIQHDIFRRRSTTRRPIRSATSTTRRTSRCSGAWTWSSATRSDSAATTSASRSGVSRSRPTRGRPGRHAHRGEGRRR